MEVLDWIWLALGAAFIAVMLRGFWRGLSMRPTDPRTRPPEELWW
ncbi:MAG: hypothetical protein ACJ8FU_07700 [Xanthobacteraceae bacterium]